MEFIQSLWDIISAGGPQSLIGLLFAAVVYLLWERQKMMDVISSYQKIIEQNRTQYSDSIVKIVQRYHEGNLKLVEALNEIKVVLSTMQKTMF